MSLMHPVQTVHKPIQTENPEEEWVIVYPEIQGKAIERHLPLSPSKELTSRTKEVAKKHLPSTSVAK